MKYLRAFAIYAVVAFCSLFAPLILKEVLSGHAGLNTVLFTIFVSAPAGLLLLGLYEGKREALIHASIFLVSNLIAFISWTNAEVNPWKELGNTFSYSYALAFGLALIVKLMFLRFPRLRGTSVL